MSVVCVTDDIRKEADIAKGLNGVVIGLVADPETPAGVAGLRPGDVIVEMNGKSKKDVSFKVNRKGTEVTVGVSREDAKSAKSAKISSARLEGRPMRAAFFFCLGLLIHRWLEAGLENDLVEGAFPDESFLPGLLRIRMENDVLCRFQHNPGVCIQLSLDLTGGPAGITRIDSDCRTIGIGQGTPLGIEVFHHRGCGRLEDHAFDGLLAPNGSRIPWTLAAQHKEDILLNRAADIDRDRRRRRRSHPFDQVAEGESGRTIHHETEGSALIVGDHENDGSVEIGIGKIDVGNEKVAAEIPRLPLGVRHILLPVVLSHLG
ncbi:MAG: PDZ domain-containing protein [Spirochaetes bacterium]|nr:PDZ domain-containing protein [Spirochaetota bacterium]